VAEEPFLWEDGRLRPRGVPELQQDRRLQREQDAEGGRELGERGCGLERPEGKQLHRHAEEEDDGERDDERRRARQVGPEDAVAQRPVRVAREHGDAPGGEVDHAGPAVEEDDAERDAGDQRPDAEAEEREEEDLPDLVHDYRRTLSRRQRARPNGRARCSSTARTLDAPTVRGASASRRRA
jgi:hypothetical protein